MRRYVLVASLLMAPLAACKGANEAPPTPAAEEAGAAEKAPKAEPEVMVLAAPKPELVEEGEAPQVALRHAWELGAKQRLKLQLGTQWQMTQEGQVRETGLPALHVTLASELTEQNGEVSTFEIKIVKVSAEGSVGAAAEMGARLGQVAEALEGLEGEIHLNASGRASGFILRDETGSLPDEVRGVLEGFEGALSQLFVAFPDEAVGAGARWSLKRDREQAKIPLVEEIQYHLKSQSDDVIVLGYEATLKPKVEGRSEVQMAGGIRLEADEISGEAEGELKIFTGQPLALIEGKETLKMRIHPDGADEIPVVLNGKLQSKALEIPKEEAEEAPAAE